MGEVYSARASSLANFGGECEIARAHATLANSIWSHFTESASVRELTATRYRDRQYIYSLFAGRRRNSGSNPYVVPIFPGQGNNSPIGYSEKVLLPALRGA
jgi:hypothetical protein